MREIHHGVRLGRLAVALVTLGTILGAAPPAAGADGARTPVAAGLDIIRPCRPGLPGRVTIAPAPPPIRIEGRLDGDGTVTGTTVLVDRRPLARLGVGGFADGPFGDRAIIGERGARQTRLVLLDLWRRCALRRLSIPGLVYGSHLDTRKDTLHVSLVQPDTRRELGIWRLDAASPDSLRLEVPGPTGTFATAAPRTGEVRWDAGGPVGRWCAGGLCQERRPGRTPSLLLAEPDATDVDAGISVVKARPVPEEPAARWPRDADLTYRWHASETPPQWMRPALRDAADDVARSKRSRTPTFRYDTSASDAFRYTSNFPSGGCSTAIACASYNVGSSWTIRYRPHGTDFRWGTLRWCQADGRDGCFDVERIGMHELGHIVGLDHPETAGFSLRPFDTVMGRLAPAKPKAGWAMHAFGPCDVATLQERYDVPNHTTPVSACNDVDTVLSLDVSGTSVPRYAPVTLVARLRIPDRDAYGRLGGNPLSERSVQLRRRPLGASNNAWSVFWMRPGDSPGTYLLTLRPSVGYEFQAVFPATGSEGLGGSSSSIVSVRVVEGCGTMPCVQTEDPMS